MNHFSWALQTLLLPGIWALGDDFVRSDTSSDVIVTAVTISLMFLICWCVAAHVVLPREVEARGDASKEDLQRSDSVAVEDNQRSASGVDQFIAWTRRDISAAMLVALVDLVLLIGLQFG